MIRPEILSDTEYGFCRKPDTSRAKTGFRTDQDFPDSKAVHDRIEARLRWIGLNDPALKEAYDTLHSMD